MKQWVQPHATYMNADQCEHATLPYAMLANGSNTAMQNKVDKQEQLCNYVAGCVGND